MEWLTNLLQASGNAAGDVGSRFGALAPPMQLTGATQPSPVGSVPGAMPGGLPGLLGQGFGQNKALGQNLAAQGMALMQGPKMQPAPPLNWMPRTA